MTIGDSSAVTTVSAEEVRPYRVPTNDRIAVLEVARMSDESFTSVLQAVSEADPPLSRAAVEGALDSVSSLFSVPAERLLSVFLGVHTVRLRRDCEPDQAAKALAADPLLKLNQVEKDVLVRRLVEVLADRRLSTIAAGHRTYRDNERILCTAQAQVSLRPVFVSNDIDFAESEPIPPDAAVLTTDLAIRYHEGNDTKTFHVTLDVRGIRDLVQSMALAVQRMQSLKEVAESAGMVIVETGDHH